MKEVEDAEYFSEPDWSHEVEACISTLMKEVNILKAAAKAMNAVSSVSNFKPRASIFH